MAFWNILDTVTDHIPGVGHAKAVVHVATGNHHKARESLLSANQCTAQCVGGTIGAIGGGPLGAVAGVSAATIAHDTVTSELVGKKYGLIEAVDNVIEDPSAENNANLALEVGFMAAGAGVGAKAGAKKVAKMQLKQAAKKQIIIKKVGTKCMDPAKLKPLNNLKNPLKPRTRPGPIMEENWQMRLRMKKAMQLQIKKPRMIDLL